MFKTYLMILENGNTLGLKARDDKDAKKSALTFVNFKALKNEKGEIILLNMGCRR